MILIVGLGNIGKEYAKTKHNIGFMLTDKICEKYAFPDFREKNNYFFTKTKIFGKDVILLKPTTFMNNSGKAVLSFASYNKINPEDIIVIHDDLDLKTGKVKIKKGGSSGGHNGLKSIDKYIGPEYWRIRIGIEHPRNVAPQMDVASYVLGCFSPEQKEKIETTLNTLCDNFEKIVQKDFEKILGSLQN